MNEIKSICVYCGSSLNPQPVYAQAAENLGRLLAQEKIRLVFGGGHVGLMGVVSDACLQHKGEVLGVMTDFLDEYEGGHRGITELRLVSSMHERKMMMFEESDAFVILPGGLGTLDETFEVLTWKQIGMHGKPIVFYDVQGYWSALFKDFLGHMTHEGFVRQEDTQLFTLVDKVDDILTAIHMSPKPTKDFVAKWG